MVETALIESRYNDILHTKMEGVAVLNHKLQVKAVGFQAFGNEQLGVLITPWFMSLMLLPEGPGEWTENDVGRKVVRTFPSGVYEFILGWDDALEGCAMCALFSPMFDFVDQAAALATAREVMKALFESEYFAPTDRQREQQKQRLAAAELQQRDTDRDDSLTAGQVANVSDHTRSVITNDPKVDSGVATDNQHSAVVSRRQFLQGRIRTKDGGEHG